MFILNYLIKECLKFLSIGGVIVFEKKSWNRIGFELFSFCVFWFNEFFRFIVFVNFVLKGVIFLGGENREIDMD